MAFGVINGQDVSAEVTNPAFIVKNDDDFTTHKVGFKDTDTANSGDIVDNGQAQWNSIGSVLGLAMNLGPTYLFTWASDIVGSAMDTVKARVEAIVAKFHNTTGHTHDGAQGNGAPISVADLIDLNQYFAVLQSTTITGATGASNNVTGPFSGQSPTGTISSEGVAVTAPNNRIEIRDALSGDQLEDPDGHKVYGRLTYSAGTWTLTYYVNDGTGEVAYSLPGSTDILIYFTQVFNQDNRPTFGADVGAIGSLDTTADVVDSRPNQRGVVVMDDAISTLGTTDRFLDIAYSATFPGKPTVTAMVENSVDDEQDSMDIFATLVAHVAASGGYTGCRMRLSATPDTANYKLHWIAKF